MSLSRCLLCVCIFLWPRTVFAQPDALPEGALLRFGASQLWHADEVKRVAWLPDGKRIATRTEYHVALWDIATRRRLWNLALPGGTQRLLEYAPPGFLITQESDGVAFLDTQGKKLFTLKEDGKRARNIAVSGNGKKLLVSWQQGEVVIYNLSAKGPQQPGHQLGKEFGRRVYAPQFSEDGNLLVFTDTKEVILWDVKKGEKVRTYQAKEHPVSYHSTRISPDGRMLGAAGSNAGRIQASDPDLYFWQTDQAEEWEKLQGKLHLTNDPVDFRFTSDSQAFVIAKSSGGFQRLETQSGKVLTNRTFSFKANSVQLSPDGNQLAIIDGKGVQLGNMSTGRLLESRAGPSIASARFIDSDRILSKGNSELIHWWEPGNCRLLKSLPKPASWENAVISPDGRWWAETRPSAGGGFLVLEPLDPDKKGRFLAEQAMAAVMTFARNGEALLSAEKDGNWNVWSTQTGKLNRRFTALAVSQVIFAGDNRSVAGYVVDSGAVAVYDAKTGQRRFISAIIDEKPQFSSALRFSPSGRYVALAHPTFLCVLSSVQGRVVLRRPTEPELRVPEAVLSEQPSLGKQSIAFSPDERWLVLGHARSSKLYLYDLDAACLPGYSPQTVEAHVGGVVDLDLSPDGKLLVSTGGEGAALVWDTKKFFKPAPKPAKLAAVKLPDDWWTALRQSKEEEVSPLIVAMIHEPDKSVALLSKHLTAVSEPDAQAIAKWITQLNSGQFVARERAAQALAELGELAAPALRASLKKPLSVDFELRVKTLLQKVDSPEALPERLRRFRAIEILERIGTPAAREVLAKLSKGAAGSRVTVAAAEALRRIEASGGR